MAIQMTFMSSNKNYVTRNYEPNCNNFCSFSIINEPTKCETTWCILSKIYCEYRMEKRELAHHQGINHALSW